MNESDLFDLRAQRRQPGTAVPVPLPAPPPAQAADHGLELLTPPDCHCCETSECVNEVSVVCDVCGQTIARGTPHLCQPCDESPRDDVPDGDEMRLRVELLVVKALVACAYFDTAVSPGHPGRAVIESLKDAALKVRGTA